MGEGQENEKCSLPLSSSPLFKELLCETCSFFCHSNRYSPQSTLSQFHLQPALPARLAALPQVLTGLVILVDFFFNSLVVRVPCSLIFWHFWLFIDFGLVVILLLVVQGSEGFLPTSPSWSELKYQHTLKCIQQDLTH